MGIAVPLVLAPTLCPPPLAVPLLPSRHLLRPLRSVPFAGGEIGCGSGWLKVTNEDGSVYYLNEMTKENTLVRGLFPSFFGLVNLTTFAPSFPLTFSLVSRTAMCLSSALSPPRSSPFPHLGGASFSRAIKSYRATRFPSTLRSPRRHAALQARPWARAQQLQQQQPWRGAPPTRRWLIPPPRVWRQQPAARR